MTGLAGRVAVVTGAARGIGRGIAEALAAEGASMVVADVDAEGAERVAEALAGAGVQALGVPVDVGVEVDARRLAETTLDAFGRVDVLVNNAGVASSSPLIETTLDEWNRVLAVDLTGVFLCSRAVAPTMIAQGSGVIVNVGSQLGLRGAPNLAAYCAAKAGVHGLTKALARELAPHGIRVNAVAPGPVDTEILVDVDAETMAGILAEIPLGRVAQVEEIAPIVALLASEGGTYFTGSVVNVSGGHVM
ncbi:MAG: 3-oxoacyl-ACP reductase FabG [Thermoleophilia bacterium]|nr:3-oxoacyl-ACP reductase FabG [Thermoleophilia bacterium]MDH4346907.1 3-oxoacyl-ACP reductase FabG [Thermoleophilia bacterium]